MKLSQFLSEKKANLHWEDWLGKKCIYRNNKKGEIVCLTSTTVTIMKNKDFIDVSRDEINKVFKD
jgi:hypothetical protein